MRSSTRRLSPNLTAPHGGRLWETTKSSWTHSAPSFPRSHTGYSRPTTGASTGKSTFHRPSHLQIDPEMTEPRHPSLSPLPRLQSMFPLWTGIPSRACTSLCDGYFQLWLLKDDPLGAPELLMPPQDRRRMVENLLSRGTQGIASQQQGRKKVKHGQMGNKRIYERQTETLLN